MDFFACNSLIAHSRLIINLHFSAWSKIFDHVQYFLNTTKHFFELADGLGKTVQISNLRVVAKHRSYCASPKFLFGENS